MLRNRKFAKDAVNCAAMKSLPWRLRFPARWSERKRNGAAPAADGSADGSADAVAPAATAASVSASPPRALPRPALRWVGAGGKIALRPFEWQADADAICKWQIETYALNFPDFHFTEAFASAFRHDLRRAILDDQHGLFVLDEGPAGGQSCGFIWLVVCQNSWTNERYGYINNLYVSPNKRGQELAGTLLDFATEWFERRRVSKLRLTVTTSNAAACRLYEKNGYQVTRLEMERDI